MSGTKAERRKAESFRARVRQMLAAGYSVARIAKETGKSYAHAEMIAAQERAGALPDAGAPHA